MLGVLKPRMVLDIPGAPSSSDAANIIVGLERSGKEFGARNISEICHTPYNHIHGCKYYCQLCLLCDHALHTATRRCPSCRLLHELWFYVEKHQKGKAGSAICARNWPVTQASSSTPCLGSKPHEQGRALLSRWDMQETMHGPNYIFAMECQMPHGMKECKRKLKENGSFRRHVGFSQLLNDTSLRAMLL